MTELERLEIVKKVTEDIMIPEKLSQKTNELYKLLLDENVIKYLRLSAEIAELQKRFSKFNGDKNKMIEYEFWYNLQNLIREVSPCNHEIWMYGGSYYLLKDPRCEHDDLIRKNLEYMSFEYGDYSFKYNLYYCLECGKRVETRDWQKFEKSHFVLKNRNYLEVEDFRNFYYQILFENSVEKAKSIIIEEFNQKQKTLK